MDPILGVCISHYVKNIFGLSEKRVWLSTIFPMAEAMSPVPRSFQRSSFLQAMKIDSELWKTLQDADQLVVTGIDHLSIFLGVVLNGYAQMIPGRIMVDALGWVTLIPLKREECVVMSSCGMVTENQKFTKLVKWAVAATCCNNIHTVVQTIINPK